MIQPRTELDELLETMESLREAKWPSVPADVVASIVRAEADNPEDEVGAAKAIAEVVNAHVSGLGDG